MRGKPGIEQLSLLCGKSGIEQFIAVWKARDRTVVIAVWKAVWWHADACSKNWFTADVYRQVTCTHLKSSQSILQ